MSTITPKCLLAGLAIALVLIQHGLYVSSVSLIEVHQGLWLVVNSVEAVLLIAVSRMLMAAHKTIAMIIGASGVILALAVVVENFIVTETLDDPFWISISLVVIFGLMLSSIYLLKNN
ncbi:hypothetical protein [Candidatus Spongiihabitans sp.]|uniref:hypothetical protein n=1 Tax=Candidatus Spongiihabitans sp. TaxID=3101308 RepID=UPI003C7C65CA